MTNVLNDNDAPAARPKTPEAFTLVILGASGDLTRRKLVPAVFALDRQGLLPESCRVLGVARRAKDPDAFRSEMRDAVSPADGAAWDAFASRLDYQRVDFDDADAFARLRRQLDERAGAAGGPGNVLFYLAVPPTAMPTIADRLSEAGWGHVGRDGSPWARIIIEKPSGHDLASARALNRRLQAAFDEDQIFRIDHYLGKETVQNLLVLRFANAIFEPLWNQRHIDHVQLTVSETVGVEGRGSYYAGAGALRDMVQNHMMHLLCLVGMEPPVSLTAHAVREEKVKVLQALRPIPPECVANGVVRAVYADGQMNGQAVPGYLQEPDVPADAPGETFAALKVHIDNWRWAGVPFYLRTGKRLPVRITEISIHFKAVPQILFNAPPAGSLPPNVLVIRIQPNEGIQLNFQVKQPGPAMQTRSLKMDFGYAESFGQGPPEAYERLLLDAALGDSTLFARNDEVEAAWAFLSPVLEGCACQSAGQLPTYAAGTWGPKEADDLMAADARQWQLFRRRAGRG